VKGVKIARIGKLDIKAPSTGLIKPSNVTRNTGIEQITQSKLITDNRMIHSEIR
jgi:hypothetical protein